MTIPDWITLENIYYLCGGPGLLIAAIISAYWIYKQIGLTKKQVLEAKKVFRTNSERESIKLSAEKCNDFKQIMEKYSNSDLDKLITYWNLEYSNTNFKVTPPNNGKDEIDEKEIIEIYPISQEILNDLEGYAIYFINGVADEEIGFLCTGKMFCYIFEDIITKVGPIVLGESSDELFSHSRSLYMIWNDKLEKKKLELQKVDLEKKIKETKSISIPSIGTQ